MAYTKGLSVKLQGKWQDIIRAYNNIEAVKKVLQDARSKVEVFHTKWFDESTLLASKVNLEPSIPRRTCHQVHQFNIPVASANDYYKFVVTIPLPDHLVSDEYSL